MNFKQGKLAFCLFKPNNFERVLFWIERIEMCVLKYPSIICSDSSFKSVHTNRNVEAAADFEMFGYESHKYCKSCQQVPKWIQGKSIYLVFTK